MLDSPQATKFYEVFDHTADVGLHIFAQNCEELLAHAGLAFTDLISEAAALKPREKREFHLEAESLEDRLLLFLRELLYQFDTERRLFVKFEVEKTTESLLRIEAWGERLEPGRHPFKTEIKAVTRHQLKVEKWGEGLRATVIFDI